LPVRALSINCAKGRSARKTSPVPAARTAGLHAGSARVLSRDGFLQFLQSFHCDAQNRLNASEIRCFSMHK
jgi:hypothetical protein